MGKVPLTTPLGHIADTKILDPTMVEAIDVVISPELQEKNDAKTARGLVAFNAAAEKIAIRKAEQPVEEPNINEADLSKILTRDDHEFYMEKKALYLAAYPDLGTDPFDLDDLHLMIMEQVFQRNILKRKKKHPNVDISKDYESSVKRQNEFKKSLSMRRTDRVKVKSAGGKTINIAKISMSFSDPNRLVEMQRRLESYRTEEAILIEQVGQK